MQCIDIEIDIDLPPYYNTNKLSDKMQQREREWETNQQSHKILNDKFKKGKKK